MPDAAESIVAETHEDKHRFATEDELRAVFLQAPIPVFLLDVTGKIVLGNRLPVNPPSGDRATEPVGLGQAIGCIQSLSTERPCPDNSPQARCRICPLRETIQNALHEGLHCHRRAVAMPVKDGQSSRQLHLLVSAIPIWVAGQKRVLTYLEDVSEMQHARMIAERFNRELERKVNQRTREVQQLLAQKQAFVTQLGHDLRTPLTPLVALLPLLRRRTTDTKAIEMIEVIRTNADFMWNLVSKTLDLIHADHFKPADELQAVDLAHQIKDVLWEMEPLLSKKRIEVSNEASEAHRVCADPLELKEVFFNVIGNALKFMAVGGRLAITVTREDPDVRVAISDTGIGMMPRQLDRIFEEFYKADESRHDRHSVGLGLSICKRIIENHHGRIWAESDGPGKGSTIFFTLRLWADPSILESALMNNDFTGR